MRAVYHVAGVSAHAYLEAQGKGRSWVIELGSSTELLPPSDLGGKGFRSRDMLPRGLLLRFISASARDLYQRNLNKHLNEFQMRTGEKHATRSMRGRGICYFILAACPVRTSLEPDGS